MQAPTELETFHHFLSEQLATGNKELSPEEFLRLWRAQQRDYDETIEAVKEGVADMEAGRVRPLRDVAEEIRRKHKSSS